MSWRTHRAIVAARKIGRSLGANQWIARHLQPTGYEVRYQDCLLSAIRPGDCIWDVGANVGHYTRQFAARTGRDGVVFAFEPSPLNFPRLVQACGGLDNVRPMQMALGSEEGEVSLQLGADDLGATTRIVDASLGDSKVAMRSGRDLISARAALPPNVIKIDVEGYEGEVVDGLGAFLSNPGLRAIGIEVHFGILDGRGMSRAPDAIEGALRMHRFDVRWVDASHIFGARHG